MLKLLRANAGRLRTDKVFWSVLGSMAFYAFFLCFMAYYQKYVTGTGNLIIFDEILLSAYGVKGYITFPAFLLAIFCSLFIGTEFSDGTIRNKIIVGRTRAQLYLSHFLTCSAVGLLMNLLFFLLVCAVGIPLFGAPTLPPATLVSWIGAGTLSILSYSALFTFLSMLVQNKTTVSIVSLITLFAAILVTTYLMSRLGQPEMIQAYEMTDGESIVKLMPNPNFLAPGPRAVVEFITDLLPTGQSLQISSLSALRPLRMALCSVGMIAATNLAGIFLFQRKDLK